jgi:hypothetical protein
LLAGLFGSHRSLYKRWLHFSYFEERPVYERLARRSYPWLVACAEALAGELARTIGDQVAAHQVLVDAPPVGLEVEFDLEVWFAKNNVFRRLGDVSPVVRTLAREQFDDYVKRVRIFVHPRLVDPVRQIGNSGDLVSAAIARAEESHR